MNAEYIRILKQARILIETNNEDYICLAIYEVTGERLHPLRIWVFDMLDGNETLDSWIIHNYHSYPETSEKTRPVRLAWIDAMIKYLEKGGKIK